MVYYIYRVYIIQGMFPTENPVLSRWKGSCMPTITELRWVGSREPRSMPTGNSYTNRAGRRDPVTELIEYVRTAGAGTMPLAEWYDRMDAAVEAEGKEDLLTEIINVARENYVSLLA